VSSISASASAAPRRSALEPPHSAALLAFAALSLFVGLRFAALLSHPPTGRVLGILAAAGACGGALTWTRALTRRLGVAPIARAAIVALGFYLALRAAGVEAGLLWPWRWALLARDLAHGIESLNGLWPYIGDHEQARVAIMGALAATLVLTAALAFWPGATGLGGRRAVALALLLGLYVIAAANERRTGWQVQGTVLFLALSMWAWSWKAPRPAGLALLAWALVALLAALVSAGMLDSSAPLIDYRSWNPFAQFYPAIAFDWNQTYGPLARSDPSETMAEVNWQAPRLLRVTTLDRFNGVRFLRSASPPAHTSALLDAAHNSRWVTHAEITIRGLSSEQILSPGQLLELHGAAASYLEPLAADGTASVLGGSTGSGTSYTVDAYTPQPDTAELRAAPRAFASAYEPYTTFQLPGPARSATAISTRTTAGVAAVEASPYAPVYALARHLAAGTSDPYEIVARIQAFLRRGFTYQEHPAPHIYPLVSFLLSERAGYCQQFSGAMALLLRMDGVPARVAAGFLPGTRNPATSSSVVQARDAHAWVEVYFAGIGWVPFDPTPPRPTLTGNASLTPAILPHGSSPQPATAHSAAALEHRSARPQAVSSSKRGRGASLWLEVGLAGALVGMILLGWHAGARRVRLELAGDSNKAVRELRRALPRLGVRLRAGMTLAELEQELQRSHGREAGRYVRALRERRYATSAGDQRALVSDRRALRRALGARRGPLARIRGLLALPPVTLRPGGE
jgi:protein-glutamine gamma-glutamyltransferase